MFTIHYTKNGQTHYLHGHYADDVFKSIENEHLEKADIISIEGPRTGQEISMEKLQSLAEGRCALPGQAVKTPRFMGVIISKTFMSETEARDAGFTDESGFESKFINILGRLMPNGRPTFAAAMR